jgi:hypothetical protein
MKKTESSLTRKELGFVAKQFFLSTINTSDLASPYSYLVWEKLKLAATGRPPSKAKAAEIKRLAEMCK